MSGTATLPRPPRAGAAGDALVLRSYERCEWYELALMRHGFTVERLQKLARKIANDALRLRGATLGDRFDDLVSRLQMAGLQAAMRYDPHREHTSYGRNGGDPFSSYVADIMDKRVDDYFRSKAEGFGDRRYGNDGRIVLAGDMKERLQPTDRMGRGRREVHEEHRAEWEELADNPREPVKGKSAKSVTFEAEVDPEQDFSKLISEGRIARWQAAADKVGWTLPEFIASTLDIAAEQIEVAA